MMFSGMGYIFHCFDRFRNRCVSEYLLKCVHSGSGCFIGAEVKLQHPENIYLGRNSYINGGLLFASPKAIITIGDNCMISYGVHIRTDSHQHGDSQRPMNAQGHFEANIEIGDDVWVGYGAQIMPGVKIGSGTIVGAGAIVTKDLPEKVVAAGVPARVISHR